MNTHPLTGYTHAMYGLHALAGFIGITSSASVVGAFVFGIPSIIAIIMNYARRDAVYGTWLDTHFRWQSRTFWGAAMLLVLLVGVALVLSLFGLISLVSTPVTGPVGAAGAGIGFGGAWLALTIGAIVTGIWILYRVIRGWLSLNAGKAMDV